MQETRPTAQFGRPRRRWEDNINEFLKLEENETENSTDSDNKYNKSWIKAAKDRGRWTLLENDYTMTAEERFENNARHRRNSQSRPARYVNGVRLSDDEVANTTKKKTKSKKRSKSKMKQFWKVAAAPNSAPCMSQSCRHKHMFEKRNDPGHLDGLMIKNFVID